MDINNCLFKTESTLTKSRVQPTVSRNTSDYATILLREYNALVDLLSRLEEKTFRQFYPEMNIVVDKLIKWFEATSTANTIDIYWNLRHLKQKIDKEIKYSLKSISQNKTPINKHILVTNYLISR